jgi:hypothetical protein
MRTKLELEPLVVPGSSGGRILRLLLAGACRFDCPDCPMSAWRRFEGSRAPLERQARAFVDGWRRGSCDGLFVTAGIPGSPVEGAETLLRFLRILRQALGFRGYVHVKAIVGCTTRQAEGLLFLADRVSWTPEPRCGQALRSLLHPWQSLKSLSSVQPAQAVADASQGTASGPAAFGAFLLAVRRRCAASAQVGPSPVPEPPGTAAEASQLALFGGNRTARRSPGRAGERAGRGERATATPSMVESMVPVWRRASLQHRLPS